MSRNKKKVNFKFKFSSIKSLVKKVKNASLSIGSSAVKLMKNPIFSTALSLFPGGQAIVSGVSKVSMIMNKLGPVAASKKITNRLKLKAVKTEVKRTGQLVPVTSSTVIRRSSMWIEGNRPLRGSALYGKMISLLK